VIKNIYTLWGRIKNIHTLWGSRIYILYAVRIYILYGVGGIYTLYGVGNEYIYFMGSETSPALHFMGSETIPWLVIMIKNMILYGVGNSSSPLYGVGNASFPNKYNSLWGRRRFLLLITYFFPITIYPFTLLVTGIVTNIR